MSERREGHSQLIVVDGKIVTKSKFADTDTAQALTSWIWNNYVGIPLGGPDDPYDKEYEKLLDRMKALERLWFDKGLLEGMRQAKSATQERA